MLIDWFTVAAQAVNFLILAWLLKRFLYGPIITAMQDRRKRLADELNNAREAREKANRQTEELSRMRETLERESQSMLAEARKTADERREHWLSEARAEVQERSKAWAEALEREQATIAEHLRIRIGNRSCGSRKRSFAIWRETNSKHGCSTASYPSWTKPTPMKNRLARWLSARAFLFPNQFEFGWKDPSTSVFLIVDKSPHHWMNPSVSASSLLWATTNGNGISRPIWMM